MDKLQLLGIKFSCKLGVYAWEQQAPQTLLLDLSLGIDNQAKITDSLEDTVDYAHLVAQLRTRYQQCSFRLIESLAEDIARFLLSQFTLLEVGVHLIKPGVLPELKQVSIDIKRANKDYACRNE